MLNCDGNPVPTIVYGSQEWAVENACNITYRDGTPIQYVPIEQLNFHPLGAYSFSPLDPSRIFYNQFAILGYGLTGQPNKVFAPEGWHVATKSDWVILAEYLITNGYNYDNTTEGNKTAKSLSSNSGWNTNTGISLEGTPGYNQSLNNSSGFNAKPVGFGVYSVTHGVGGFFGEGDYSYFCSSSFGVAIGVDNYQLGITEIGTLMPDYTHIDINISPSTDYESIVPFYYFPVRLVKD